MPNEHFKEYFINYFDTKEPVCREERQYALFLYNKLLSVVGKEWTDIDETTQQILLKLKLTNIKLLSVAYEATFMRDLFEKDRFERFKKWFKNDKGHAYDINTVYVRAIQKKYKNDRRFIESKSKDDNAFNNILVMHFKDDKPEDYYDNVNFGSNNHYVKWASENTNCRTYVKIKPDLSVLYMDNKKELHLRFLECKYLSAESKAGKETQTQVQSIVCRFICDDLLGGKVIADKADIVRFASELNNKSLSSDDCIIWIKDIIPQSLVNEELKKILKKCLTK